MHRSNVTWVYVAVYNIHDIPPLQWYKLVTTPHFAIGKPFVRQPWGDTRVTPEDRRRAVAQRAVEVAKRRVIFDANNNN